MKLRPLFVQSETFLTPPPPLLLSLLPSLFSVRWEGVRAGGMAADTTPQALVRVYEPEKDQWQALTSMPTPRYGATSFLRGNKIYVLGRSRPHPPTPPSLSLLSNVPTVCHSGHI
ncbi:unnamed protein product [Oncorhynchus mykiss]|uniref:Uncharacterized protein n=1 Tax=Oncorhynchus mykiss TaxID=8022 RepID=A0A060Z8Q5_ONCMY|nr:unnamed protein product [Oncorhynchus mykiss]